MTAQWWLDVREPPKEVVAAHLVNLCWNGDTIGSRPGPRRPRLRGEYEESVQDQYATDRRPVIVDPTTPIIVGVGEVSERLDEPGYRGLSAVELGAGAASLPLRTPG